MEKSPVIRRNRNHFRKKDKKEYDSPPAITGNSEGKFVRPIRLVRCDVS
jgi:hypothetical protein